MGGKEANQFIFNAQLVLEDVPAFVVDWFKDRIADQSFTASEFKDFNKLLTNPQAEFFWQWISKRLAPENELMDAFDQMSAPILNNDNIIEFFKSVVLLKKQAKDAKVRKFNVKKYYRDHIERLTDLEKILAKYNRKLIGQLSLFSNNPVRFNFPRSEYGELQAALDKTSDSPIDGAKLLSLSERDLVGVVSAQNKIVQTVIKLKSDFYKKMEKISKGAGKINEPNAEALFYCHQLVWHFQTFLSKKVSPKIIADLANLIMSPTHVFDENHTRSIIKRSISRKKS